MATNTTKPSTGRSGPGTLVRMRVLSIRELPRHPDLASQQQDGAPELHEFVANAIEESNGFMTTYMPQHFSVKDAKKQASPSTAPVKLLTHEIKPSDLPDGAKDSKASGNETWFARESIHENEAKDGTASWEEFDFGLRYDHSQHEKDYTPDVFDAHEVMNWNTPLDACQRKINDWEDVHVSVMEMAHKIPPPLTNRVFPEIVITAKRGLEFIVVQIPVTTQGLPNAKYHEAPKITRGMYCSIERGELIEAGKMVRWQMATASDAKGALPMWAQKMGVPGAVVKDVGLFIKWCAERRKVAKA